MKPVLIMSSERSGSNLLRKLLGAHSSVAAPPPPHLWLHLSAITPDLGSLDDDQNLERLIDAALRMTRVTGSHLHWPHGLTRDDVASRLRARNLSGVCGALYEALAEREGAAVWICKENRLFDHALSIRAAFPETRVVYLCRDGRDYACSVKRVPTHDQHIYCIAEEWSDEQRRCLLVHQDLAAADASRLVRYEDLIEAPERSVRALCEFIGIGYEPAMLDFHERDDAKRDAGRTEYWQNLDKPVMSENRGKFRRQLSADEIRLFESVAAAELSVLGYPLVHEPAPRRISGLRRMGYRLINGIQSRLKRRRLYREAGRRERDAMLREIYAIAGSHRRPWAPPLTYDS